MTPEFEQALGLWESGELSRDELSRRFPDEDVAGVLDAFDRMNVASAGATPDAGAAWAAVRTRLPVRLADRRRGRGKAIRLLAAATIVLLVLGATAYAVVPSVRRAMNDAAGAITGDPNPLSHPTRPAGSAGAADQATPDISGDDEATDPDEGAAGENDADEDADEDDAEDDSNAGSDDGVEGDSGAGGDDGSTEDGSDPSGGSGDEDSGSGEERASDASDSDGSGPGSEDPDE